MDDLGVLLGVLHEFLHLLKTNVNQVPCRVLVIVILCVGYREKLTAAFLQEESIDMLAVLKLLEVVFDIAAELFMTLVARSPQHKRNDVAKTLSFRASLGQNDELLKPFVDDHEADLQQVHITNV